MNAKKNVGVIGGGLGGLAAACTLAARGHSVTLFEKNAWLGGKAARLEEEGFRFDMGPTILTVPEVLRRIYREAGRDSAESLKLVRLDPQWRCFFTNGAALDLVEDTAAMADVLGCFSREPDAAQGYGKFMNLSERLHAVSEKFFFWKSVEDLRDTLDFKTSMNLSTIEDLLSLQMGRTVAEVIRSHTRDCRIAQMLDHFTQYVGSSPYRSPAVLCAIAHMQTQGGIWYPAGGTRAVPLALQALAADLGVELRTGCAVERIVAENGKVAGIRTQAGEFVSLAAVVSNADSARTYRELLGGSAAEQFNRRRLCEPACSGVVLFLGLDRAYGHLLHHNFVFSENPREEFDWIYRKGEPAPDPSCYVAAPARTEPAVAPAGGEALYVLVHTPYLRDHHDWKRMLPLYRQTILKKLEQTGGMEGIEKHIVFERALTPQDIHERYRVLKGAIYGLASHGRFFGAFKPGNRSRYVKGLYLAGGSAHPGPGMPMALMSGWIAADVLDRDATPAGRHTIQKQCASGSSDDRQQRFCRRRGYPLPGFSSTLFRFFAFYNRRYFGRNFHRLRVSKAAPAPVLPEGPVIFYTNHPSWWDPVLMLILASRYYPDRQGYAPMDAEALKKYGFFKKIGVFGVEDGTFRGAAAFLCTSLQVLRRPGAALWITAEGRFTDSRQRPVRLRPGIAHLARQMDRLAAVPIAFEYPFWRERFPEALIRFGTVIPAGRSVYRSVHEWTAVFEHSLQDTMDALAAESLSRNPDCFDVLIQGRAGIGGAYDLWRRCKALAQGKSFYPGHTLEKQ